MAAVYQRQLSVLSLRGRLMSTSESWGVNGHTTRCTSPVSVVLLLRLRLVSGWGLRKPWKRRSAPTYGPVTWGSGKEDFTFSTLFTLFVYFACQWLVGGLFFYATPHIRVVVPWAVMWQRCVAACCCCCCYWRRRNQFRHARSLARR